ncbi:MAG: hypothetical protein PF448_02055 [Bacteroidales bacterium]|jgi:hypothetical protein|nr:hypothetical protein [Bacteroidales bacterium]
MKRIIILVLISGFLVGLSACTTKPDCEYNHTGTLTVINLDNTSAEVRIDGDLLFDLQPGQEKEATLASGQRAIRCFSGAEESEELQETLTILDCESTEFEIEF